MNHISDILISTAHRPFALPKGEWKYYQEWNNALFFHWNVPLDILRRIVPEKFSLDTFNGNCYVSLVAFTMQKMRPKHLPSISLISDFDEINLRTYVINDNKPGVYFLNIEACRYLASFLARHISGLPYEKAELERKSNIFLSINKKKGVHLSVEFVVKSVFPSKTPLIKWLTERYCLYLTTKGVYYRYTIHHKEWDIKELEITKADIAYKVGEYDLGSQKPDIVHYSDGVRVLAWGREQLY